MELIERGTLFVILLASLLIVAAMTRHAAIGLDLTDEGFYLNWIVAPHAYPHSVTQFGFVFHPLYVLLDGNLVRLRQLNLLLTYGVAWWCVWVAWDAALRAPVDWLPRASVSAALALPALLVLAGYTATPSYNTLDLQGLLLAFAGAIMAGRGNNPRSLCGWFLLTLGTWLVFIAKPPSALFEGVVILAFVVATRRASIGKLAACIALGVVFAGTTGMLIDGSLAQFFQRLYRGYTNTQLLQAGHDPRSLIRWDWLYLGKQLDAALLVLFATGSGFGYVSRRVDARTRILVATLSVLACVYAALIMGWWWTPDWPIGIQKPRLPFLLAFPAGFVIAAAWPSPARRRPSREVLLMASTAMALMYCFAVGSNNNYVIQMIRAGCFGVLGIAMLLAPRVDAESCARTTMMMCAGILAVSGTLFYGTAHDPKRQLQPLHQQSASLQ
ncbi:MAG: hypothetical protein KDD77_17835, partial [Caldilineaceae bacterium]|nr:hypothetical protein [Caldilineaceae bacterium]